MKLLSNSVLEFDIMIYDALVSWSKLFINDWHVLQSSEKCWVFIQVSLSQYEGQKSCCHMYLITHKLNLAKVSIPVVQSETKRRHALRNLRVVQSGRKENQVKNHFGNHWICNQVPTSSFASTITTVTLFDRSSFLPMSVIKALNLPNSQNEAFTQNLRLSTSQLVTCNLALTSQSALYLLWQSFIFRAAFDRNHGVENLQTSIGIWGLIGITLYYFLNNKCSHLLSADHQ